MGFRRAVDDIQNAVASQWRGRTRAWRLALPLSLISLILKFYWQKPTCALMFYPADLAWDYAVFGLCVFLLIGLTNYAKLVFGIVMFFAMSPPLITLRIPRNEHHAVQQLRVLESVLKVSKVRAADFTATLNSDSFALSYKSYGYFYEYSSDSSKDRAESPYYVGARPCFYCHSGQRSYLLEENGHIHYTYEDRSATIADALMN